MRACRSALLASGLLALAACVPADEALTLGSVQFTFTASSHSFTGLYAGETAPDDGYAISFERIILGFKTMTVGKIGAPDTCSYRGRGAVSNVVFNPLFGTGLVQTFNGIQPVDCPDVGVIFGAPDNATVLDNGATHDQLIELAEGGLHAIVDATATPPPRTGDQPYLIQLRFNPITTSTRFGGCQAGGTGGTAVHGTRIFAGKRDAATVFFAPENLFRDAISRSGKLRAAPFIQADLDGDHIVTMTELDNLRLSTVRASEFYQVPASPTTNNVAGAFPSLGDFVRFLFRFTLEFRIEDGLCTGNEPGTTDDGNP